MPPRDVPNVGKPFEVLVLFLYHPGDTLRNVGYSTTVQYRKVIKQYVIVVNRTVPCVEMRLPCSTSNQMLESTTADPNIDPHDPRALDL